MSGFIVLIVAASFGLWGYHKRLYPVWAFTFNVLIAVYLGLMLTPTILEIESAGEMLKKVGPYANVLVMTLTAVIYLVIAQFISSNFLTKTYCISFHKWVDNIGGMVLGFTAGLIIINFIFFVLAASPLKSIPKVSKFIPNNTGDTVIHSCKFVSELSLQYGDKNIAKAIEIINQPPVFSDSNSCDPKTESVPQNTQSKRTIPDINEQ